MQEVCQNSEMMAILAAAQRREPAAVDQLYLFYADKLYRYIVYRVVDRELAEDLTAEVFMRLLEHLPRFTVNAERPVASFSSWLYRIASNLIADHYRAQAKGEETHLDEHVEVVAERDDIAEVLESASHAHDLRSALAALNDDQRQVIVFKFMEGLDNREVASVMGKTEGAVKSLQHRALVNLALTLRRVHL